MLTEGQFSKKYSQINEMEEEWWHRSTAFPFLLISPRVAILHIKLNVPVWKSVNVIWTLCQTHVSSLFRTASLSVLPGIELLLLHLIYVTRDGATPLLPPLVQREIVFNFPHKPPFVGVTPKKRYSFEIRNCLYLKKHFSSFSQLPEFGFNKFRLNKRKISVARPLHFLTSTQKLKLHDHRHNLHFLIIKSFLKVSFKVFWEQCPFSSWQKEDKSFC